GEPRRSEEQELVHYIFSGDGFAGPMVDNVRRIAGPIDERRRRKTIETFVILAADQEEIWKLEGIRIRLGIELRSHCRIDIDVHLIQRDSPQVVRLQCFRNWKLRGQLNQRVLAPAHSLEDKSCQIG